MPCHRGITRSRWPISITTRTWPGVCFGVILGVLVPWLAVMAADEEGFVVPPDGAMRAAGPVGRERDIAEILATRERTKGAFGIFRIEIAPKSGPPAHIHRGEDEFFYVLKGQFQFKLGEQLVEAPAGSFVFLPRDHIHTFQNIGTEPGLLLIGVTPAGLEKLFEERQGVSAETEHALMKKYGVEVVGPPLGSASTPGAGR
jgi:quercetin dioxygenase-like cupin family protein